MAGVGALASDGHSHAAGDEYSSVQHVEG